MCRVELSPLRAQQLGASLQHLVVFFAEANEGQTIYTHSDYGGEPGGQGVLLMQADQREADSAASYDGIRLATAQNICTYNSLTHVLLLNLCVSALDGLPEDTRGAVRRLCHRALQWLCVRNPRFQRYLFNRLLEAGLAKESTRAYNKRSVHVYYYIKQLRTKHVLLVGPPPT